jgi:hypothetical protein
LHAIRGVASRRALLAGGALVLLAGCGEEDEEGAAARPADVLLGSLAAERAFAASASASPRIAARSRARAQRLAAAVSAEGGRPHDTPAPEDGSGDPVELGRAALAAHIAALPGLEGRERRRLAIDLVKGAAADVAVLGDELGRQAVDPFPGSGT